MRQRAHAIVLGGGIGGLLAARAAAEHFCLVTVVERDLIPAEPSPRKGAPQGYHTHGLLARGRQIMEYWFPGFTDELAQRGAMIGDLGQAVSWLGHQTSLQPVHTGLTGIVAPRPLVECGLRQRLLAMSRVRFREGCKAEELIHDDVTRSVTGVKIRVGGKLELLAADLIIDARGRGAPVTRQLAEWGYGSIPESRIDIGLGYVTRLYRRDPADLDGRLGIVVAGGPPSWRTGVIACHGPDLWTVSIGGYFGDHPAMTEDGFLEFARTMPTREIAAVIERAKPVSDLMTIKYPASRRRDFALMREFPTGYLPFADAICSFNPVYGQGMSVAAEQSLLLDTVLADGDDHSLAQRFFEAAETIISTAWSMSTGNDLRHPKVDAPRSIVARAINRYMTLAHRAAAADGQVSRTFLEVANLMAPPSRLFSPSTLWRVAKANLRLAGTRAWRYIRPITPRRAWSADVRTVS
ncbi:monooxygenase [Novosphingobium sp. EMRT-2]|uniref:monooxygenase n=1 Tax=Novosphingobium sp. EMRT-2 TaxID=2571749 RepID=UPI0010BD58B3|nr:monooxygenase [Novosphingobium sp. EMRT-2]QCI92377.1 monooxygenase [Novosphingobium sp. EMRT-2]